MSGFNLKCISMTRQFSFFFIKKRLLILHCCVAAFSGSSHKELKIINSLKNAFKKSSIFIKVVDLKRNTSNFLQKNICTYYLPFLKKLCIEFEVFWKSPDLIGQVYVRGIPVRYSQYIWKKIPYEILGIFQYYKIRPVSKQPAQFFVTAKTYKFKSLEEINVDQLNSSYVR